MTTSEQTSELINCVCLDDKVIRRQECEHCAIRQRMLFSQLDLESLSTWLWPIHQMRCDARTVVYHQGQPAQTVFSLRQGFIKLVRYSENGDQHIVRLLGPGSCVGLEAMLQDTYEHQAEALTDVDFCAIPVKTINAIQHQQPSLCKEIGRHWQQHLNQADTWLSKLLAGPVKRRVSNLLVMLHDLQKLPNNQVMLMSNQDIASILATTEETVSRCLSQLRRDGLITPLQKRYFTVDLPGLAANNA
ncbi:Transcriptional regulator LdrP [BD1-7 clade bacterium]|uniref:Transcriptional regulator LdrP n=1 Tax=BD1-7 clade bacterium TaxID=2029982 RepID=A0A5S9QZI4_9GAMM|nr:Transcriptional regulator LdrP [BD1-7 clade bacterium]